MKTKFASVLVVFAILLLPLFPIVLPQYAYAADKNASVDAEDQYRNSRATQSSGRHRDAYSEKIINGRPYA